MVKQLIAWWESVKRGYAEEILAEELARAETDRRACEWWEHECDVCDARLLHAETLVRKYEKVNAKLVRKLEKYRKGRKK